MMSINTIIGQGTLSFTDDRFHVGNLIRSINSDNRRYGRFCCVFVERMLFTLTCLEVDL